MDLPEIAIVVSSASALFTAVNVVVSYRTFKRVRPNVKVWLSRTGLSVTESGIDGGAYVFILRFLNNGTTPVSVERVELWTSRKRIRREHLVHGKRFERGVTNHEPPVVPALDGTVYRYHVPRSALPEENVPTRFRVLLSNGRVAYSPLVPGGLWFYANEVGETMEIYPAEGDE